MSQVRKVKGVSFNWLQFLWNNVGQIRKAQIEGNISLALKETATLISYLPPDLKEIFEGRAKMIRESINTIVTGNLPKLQEVTDVFHRRNLKQKILATYSEEAFDAFINDLTTELNARGYMESVEFVDEGIGTSWRLHQEKFQKKGKTD